MEKSWFHWTFEINCQEASHPSVFRKFNYDHSTPVELVLRLAVNIIQNQAALTVLQLIRSITLWFDVAKIHR